MPSALVSVVCKDIAPPDVKTDNDDKKLMPDMPKGLLTKTNIRESGTANINTNINTQN